jgi:glutamate synthase (NADPH/NADH) small chain
MGIRDVFSPFAAWKHLFRDPVSIKDPLNRPGAPRYRGFHQNDIEKCIGCGTCETICQNGAIDMVPVEGIATQQGDSGLRPKIDYGRCCWCALCIDVCMTRSLTMSNAYTWVGSDADEFRFTPGVDKKDWDNAELGYFRPDGHRLTGAIRIAMDELRPAARSNNFQEIVQGYTIEQAALEADRCVACGLCIATCPAHMSIPQYIGAVREGDYEYALKLLYETNPFSQVCGRVCTHKCEDACAARHEGDPIAIRWLKRHITDQVPYERYRAIVGKPAPASGKRVAIIGAGPAGLTAAYDLAMKGHQVAIYEGLPQPGGMIRYGIPEYRLPYNTIDDEVGVITAMGVEIHCNTWVGRDISMQQLEEDNDAVIIANGLHLGRSTRIPGSDHAQVVSAIELLRKITLGEAFDIPKRAVVIGGGNVAMDIARSLLRLQKASQGEVDIIVTTLEAREQMMADLDEIKEAEEEGVVILNGRGPRQCVVDNQGLSGLETVCCVSVFDEQGRFHPQYDDTDVCVYGADLVVEAIGQAPNNDFLGEALTERLEWERGRLKVDENGRTSERWLWAAGDAVEGPDVIHAVAGGHRVASSIHLQLSENTKVNA